MEDNWLKKIGNKAWISFISAIFLFIVRISFRETFQKVIVDYPSSELYIRLIELSFVVPFGIGVYLAIKDYEKKEY